MTVALERLVVSLDADIVRLSRQMQKAGIVLDDFAKTADSKAGAAKDAINRHLGGGSGGLSTIQFQELSSAARHSFDAIIAGASPLKVLATEGIKASSAIGPGGLGGLAKQLGTSLSAFLTPARLATGGIAAVGAAALYSYSQYETAQTAIKTGLLGVGAASHATVADISGISEQVSSTSKISVSAARQIATALAATGRIGVGQIGGIADLAKGYGVLTGQDTEAAGKDLAKLFADPAKGAEELNGKLGALDGATLHYIQTLAAAGNLEAAQKVLLAAVQPQIAKAAQNVSLLAAAWDRLKSTLSAISDRAGAGIAEVVDPNVQQQIEQLENLQRFKTSRGAADPQITAQIEALKAQTAAAQKADKAQADLTKAKLVSADANPALEEADPALAEIIKAQAQAGQIQNALQAFMQNGVVPEGGAEHAVEALDSVRAKLAQLRADYALGGTAAAEALRQANFQSATAGLSSYARGLAEINFQYDEQVRKAKTAANSADAIFAAGQQATARREALTSQYLAQPSQYSHSISQVPDQYRALVLAAAQRNQIDPNLFASLGFAESSFVNGLTSSTGNKGLYQLGHGVIKDQGVTDVFDPEQNINAAAAYFAQQLRRYNENPSTAIAAYHDGHVTQGDISTSSQKARDEVAAITQQTPDFKQQADSAREADRAVEGASRSYSDLKANLGKSNQALQAAQEAQKEENAVLASGAPLSEQAKKQIQDRANALADLAQKTSLLHAADQAAFEQQQLGRSPQDAAIYSQLRSAGIDANTPGGQQLVGTLQQLHELQDVKDTGSSFTKGLVNDLIQGTRAGQALENQLQRILSKVADSAIDNVFSSLFSSVLKSGGGGFLSGLGGLLGGVLHFAGGGRVVGAGTGTSDSVPALLSHGEYVVNAAQSRKYGGLLAALNSGNIRHFAAGGSVSLPSLPAAARVSSVASHNVGISVDARGAQGNAEIEASIARGVTAGMNAVAKRVPAMMQVFNNRGSTSDRVFRFDR